MLRPPRSTFKSSQCAVRCIVINLLFILLSFPDCSLRQTFLLFMTGSLLIPGHFLVLCFSLFFLPNIIQICFFILMLPSSAGRGGYNARVCMLFSWVIRLLWCGSALSAGLARPLIRSLVSAKMNRCPVRGFVAWGRSKESWTEYTTSFHVSLFLSD